VIKKILIGVAVLLVILAGGAYYLYSNLGGIIKAAIENYGSQATQSQVKINDVKLSLTSGEGAISGLTIANPKGYSAANAFALGLVSLKVDPASATKNPVVIKEIIIDKPQISYEMGAQGGSNLQTIQNNVNAFAKKMGGGDATAKQPDTASKEPERKLIIESLSVRNGQIAASHAALKGEKISVGLPTISLTNIGKAKGGATPAEVANEVIGAISAQAQKVATLELQKKLKDQLGGAAKDALGGAGGAASGAGDQLRGLIGR
jgi:uncharacterized protein involved in outer membrane biogenesis